MATKAGRRVAATALAILIAMPLSATAQESGANASSTSGSVSSSQAGAQGGSVSNNVSITEPNGSSSGTQTVGYTGSYSVKTAPPVYVPALTTTLSDTCMGSVSVGFSVTGFGLSGGKTYVDDACVRRLDAREFRAMGFADVAMALLCQSEANRRAVEESGRTCPNNHRDAQSSTSQNAVADAGG